MPNNILSNFLAGVLGALLVSCIVVLLTPPQKTIGTIDIAALTQQYIQLERQKNISDDALKGEIALYGQRLERAIIQLASQNHLILLPREAVMAGSSDYTKIISKSMENSAQGEGNVQ